MDLFQRFMFTVCAVGVGIGLYEISGYLTDQLFLLIKRYLNKKGDV